MLMPFFGLETEPLSAPRLFSLGPLDITNAMLFSVITGTLIIIFLLIVARYSQLRPKSRVAYAVEMLIDFIWGVAISTFGNRKTALKHLPLLATLFIFILIGNLSGSGLLPGISSVTASSDGETNPLLRPFTTDLNATLAMAVTTIGLVQFYALRQLGLRKHLRHYFTTVTPSLKNPMNYFIGFIEVFGELLRIVTLSMRLFGVIYAGEVLIHAVSSLAGNFGWLATVPTVLLEIFFSVIQAYVFMMLTATYLSVALGDEHEHEEKTNSKAEPAHA